MGWRSEKFVSDICVGLVILDLLLKTLEVAI